MTSTQFRLIRVIGDRPAGIPADAEVFNAPRPLYGTEVDTGLMGFTFYVTADHDYRDEKIAYNFRMDAQVIHWLTHDEVLAEARRVIDAEYPNTPADELDEDVLLDVWAHRFRVSTVGVEVETGP